MNGESFEYTEEDGSTESLTVDLTFIMWLLGLSMIVTCLWIYQVKSTIELVKPIFLENKQEKFGNHVQMSRRSKETDTLLMIIKKLAMATVVTKCLMYYILGTQLCNAFDTALDHLIDKQIEDGELIVFSRTRNNEVTSGMNLMSFASLYVDPSNTQKQSHVVQQLTQYQTVHWTT